MTKSRVVSIFLIVACSLSPAQADGSAAASSNSRTESYPYTGQAPGVYLGGGNLVLYQGSCYDGIPGVCVKISPKKGDRYITFEVHDATTTPIYFLADYGRGNDYTYEACSKTEKPIAVRAGLDVYVHLVPGKCGGLPGVVTRGEITVSFHKQDPR